MTTHQDNATRMARIAQIMAVIVVIAAVAAFMIPVPAKQIATNARTGPDQATNPADGSPTTEHFRVLQEDWLIALAPLIANHSPVAGQTNPDQDPTPSPGELDPNDPRNPAFNDDTRLSQRPPIRYLGSLEDPKGFAALIEFAGRQFLLRIGQEFESDFEITQISEDEITVSDGFDEFTFEIAQSNLANALPTQIPQAPRGGNPNAFPPGSRNPQGQPRNPAGQTNPNRPGQKGDDDEGSPA